MESNVEPSNEDDSQRQSTPLPWTKVSVICLTQFTNSFSLTVIGPLLPFMIHDFFPYLDASQLGLYSGFLAGAFPAGSFFGNILWGRVADTYGRRPVLLIAPMATLVCVLCFGFSMSIIWAITFRFLWGLLNGIIAVNKAYLSEICDDSNIARGFSVMGTSAATARILGPIVAGFMSCAASKYEVFNTAILRDFPYLLPCVFSAILCFITWIGVVCSLKETIKISPSDHTSHDNEMKDYQNENQRKTHKLPAKTSMSESDSFQKSYVEQDIQPTTSTSPLIVSNIEGVNIASNTKMTLPGHRYSVNTSGSEDDDDECEAVKSRRNRCCVCCPWRKHNTTYYELEQISDSSPCLERCKKLLTALSDRRVLIALSLLGITALCNVMTRQIIPLLLVTDYAHGGYDFDTTEISFMYAMVAVPEILYQLIMYPRITKLLGFKRSLQVGLVVFACFSALLPNANKITGPIFVADDPLNTSMPLTEQNVTFSSSISLNVQRPLTTPSVQQISAPMIQHHLQSQRQIGKLSQVISEPQNWTRYVDKLSENSIRGNIVLSNGTVTVQDIVLRKSKDLQSFGDYTAAQNDYSINVTINTTVKSPKDDKSSTQLWRNTTDNLVKRCEFKSDNRKYKHGSVKRIPIKVWLVLIIFLTGSMMGRMTALVSTNVIIGNSSLSKDKATVYGVAQSTLAFFTSFGPVVGGNIFAWSEKNGLPWPLNYHLMYYIIFFILNITAAASALLPKSINKRRIEEE